MGIAGSKGQGYCCRCWAKSCQFSLVPTLPWAEGWSWERGGHWGYWNGCVCWRREGTGGRREGAAQHNREVAPKEANEPQLARETALAYLPAHSICPSLGPWFIVWEYQAWNKFSHTFRFSACECLAQKTFIRGQKFLPTRKDCSTEYKLATVFFLLDRGGGKQVNMLPTLNHFWQPNFKCHVLFWVCLLHCLKSFWPTVALFVGAFHGTTMHELPTQNCELN